MMEQEKYEDTKLYVKVNREEIEQYLKNSHSGINDIIDGNTNGIHFHLMSDKDLSDHNKELVTKVCKDIKDRAYKNVGYHICECGKKSDIECIDFEDLCEIIDQIQKDIENGNTDK